MTSHNVTSVNLPDRLREMAQRASHDDDEKWLLDAADAGWCSCGELHATNPQCAECNETLGRYLAARGVR